MTTYAVKEIFPTVQGEGRWAGRRAVFLRLAGCNIWSGRPEDRVKGKAGCARWCDTDFVGGQKMRAEAILSELGEAWGDEPHGRTSDDTRMVVITGGEPTLQLDEALVRALHLDGWYVAVETNGTNDVPALDLCDHVCVSPKAGSKLARMTGGELKVVLPGHVSGAPLEHRWKAGEVREIGRFGKWGALFVQPQDPTREAATGQTYLHAIRQGAAPQEVSVAGLLYDSAVRECLDFIRANPGWRLSVQTHKLIGVP